MKKIELIQAGIFAVLVGGAPLAFAGGGDDGVSDSDCLREWNQSSADTTCHAKATEAVSKNDCRIWAQCRKSNKTFNYNASITVRLDDVDDLANCNGELRVGGC